MPHYLAIGVTFERFMDSCPKELEPYDKAHRIEVEEKDALEHLWWRYYGISALTVAIDHCFSKNPKSEYINNPIMQDMDNQGKELSEEEKQRQVDLFFKQENARRIKWKRNHRKDDSVS